LRIVDAQLHEFGPLLDWGADAEEVALQDRLLMEIVLAWMDAVGIDAAVLNPSRVGQPPGWGERAAARFPDRFAVVQSIRDPEAEPVQEEIASVASRPGVVAVRIGLGRLPQDPTGAAGAARLAAGAFEPVFAACEAHAVPLFCFAAGNLSLLPPVLEAYPGLTLIIDHIGMRQPPLDELEVPPWRSLGELLSLARYPGAAIKLCGAAAMSHEQYPFRDVWAPLRSILDAFGPERVMWASDIGRFAGRIGWSNQYPVAHAHYHGRHTYAESLGMLLHTDLLTQEEKRLVLGASAVRLLSLTHWEQTPAG
jgi:predicted TIM-barrel fold metal-dependent hydrolase